MVLIFLGIRYFVLSPETEIEPGPITIQPIDEEHEPIDDIPPITEEPKPETPPVQCPDGFSSVNGKCYASCPEGMSPYDLDKTKCVANCPDGFTIVNNGGHFYCQANNSVVDRFCSDPNQIMIDGGCYNQCESNYEKIDMKCYLDCPAGFNKDTMYCSNIQSYPPQEMICPNGYTYANNQCQENCTGDYEMVNGSCYQKCPPDFIASGNGCLRPAFNRESYAEKGFGTKAKCEAYGQCTNCCELVAAGRWFLQCPVGSTQSTNASNKATCYTLCPAGYTELDYNTCTRPIKHLGFQGRGCHNSEYPHQQNGMCYHEGCTDPYKQDPSNPNICYLECPEGFLTEGNRCLRPSTTMELLDNAVCPTGYEMISGSCFAHCPEGFTRSTSDSKYCEPYTKDRTSA